MASTTTNLGLTKPAYSDDADISDINGNMDLIDAEAGKVRANVAANYDSSETYAVGDYCLHDGSLYKCTTAISSPESWTAGHWTQIKIAGELSSLSDYMVTLLKKGKSTIQTLTFSSGVRAEAIVSALVRKSIARVVSVHGYDTQDMLVFSVTDSTPSAYKIRIEDLTNTSLSGNLDVEIVYDEA